MRKSIGVKLFVITFLGFILFLLLTILCQTLFFKKFYLQSKQKKAISEMNAFSKQYKKSNWSGNTLNKKIKNFNNKNESIMLITNKNGAIKKLNDLKIVIDTGKNKNLIIPLKNISSCEKLQQLNFFIGKTATIRGNYIGKSKKYFKPLCINSGNMQWDIFSDYGEPSTQKGEASTVVSIQDKKSKYTLRVTLKKKPSLNITHDAIKAFDLINHSTNIEGHISYLNSSNSKSELDIYKINLFLASINNWFSTSSKRSQNSIESFFVQNINKKENSTSENNIIFVKRLKGSPNGFIFVMESLKSANEVFQVMGQYYVYVFVIAFIVILITAIIFAKTITKPLIKINNTTLKLSKMDFSEKIDITSKDEIGILSASINTLSDNLKSNIAMLKEANEKLTDDILKERQLEKTRKDFIAAASHELKTPLSIIGSFAEGLKDGVSLKKQDHYLDVIISETQKMNSLVMEMLLLSKLEAGNQPLNKEAFDISKLVTTATKRFIHIIKERNIKIVYTNLTDSLYVKGDKNKIEEVLTNILSNSLRYVWDTHSIYISLEVAADDVTVIIENEGPTIPEDKIAKVWDSFYIVEESRSKNTGGSGLGLSIVKNILELHDCDYGIANTDKGVKYYFTLPLSVTNEKIF